MGLKQIVVLFVMGVLGSLLWFSARWKLDATKEHQGGPVPHYRYDVDKILNINNVVPVAIIGSGPAGLSAAVWTARAKYKTLVFAGPKPGGQLTEVQSIENWPGRPKTSGFKAIDDVWEQAERFGAQIIYDTVSKVNLNTRPFEIETEKGAKLYALSLLVATGGTPKRLEVPGVKEYWGKGVGICSVCDAPLNQDKKVIVVGGSDSAGDRALQFAAYAKEVIMVVREPELEACGTVQEYLEQNKKISFLFTTEIEEIVGDGTQVTGVTIRDNTTGERKRIAIDGVYFAIGYIPNSDLVKDFVETDEKGFIKRKEGSQKTSVEGVFVAGDVDDNPHRKAVVGMGNGVEAALNMMDFLKDSGFSPSVTKKLNYPSFVAPDKVEIANITTMKELHAILEEEKIPVLVDFYASYCSFCRALLPELNMLAAEYEDEIKMVKVERSEASNEVFDHFGVKSVPYYIMFKQGKELTRSATIATPRELREFIATFIKKQQS